MCPCLCSPYWVVGQREWATRKQPVPTARQLRDPAATTTWFGGAVLFLIQWHDDIFIVYTPWSCFLSCVPLALFYILQIIYPIGLSGIKAQKEAHAGFKRTGHTRKMVTWLIDRWCAGNSAILFMFAISLASWYQKKKMKEKVLTGVHLYVYVFSATLNLKWFKLCRCYND